MAAPKLTFNEKEKEKRETRRSTPPPPARVKRKSVAERRIDSGLSWGGRLWSGIESIPGGLKDQEEEFRHAIAKDVSESKGIAGAVTYPTRVYLQTAIALAGDKKDRAKLKRIAKAPLTNRGKRSALDTIGEPFIREGYHTTKQATFGYGPKKTKEIWRDNPVAAIGGAAVLVAPAARLGGIGTLAKTIKQANRVPVEGGTRAMTTAEATKLATVESYYPGSLDAMGLKGSPFTKRVSGRAVSRNPLGRAGQKAFDWASEKADVSPHFGPGTPLSATRRAAAGARRADDLDRSRLITNAMRHVTTFADYLNDGYGERIKTALGRRKEPLAARDAAVGAALHASSTVDPVEAVRFAAEDTKAILQSGVRDAHHGDIGDLAPEQRVGQTVFLTHGLEDGVPIREKAEVIDSTDERVTVRLQDGSEKTVKHSWAHLTHEGQENKIPLSPDEIKMLERRYDHLTQAHQELLEEPRLQEKFRAATQSMADLGQMNEDLGVSYYTRGLDPTGSEALAIEERLTARRNQFLDRLGGEGPGAIDYDAGLWGDLQRAMDESGAFTDEQQFVFLSVLDRQARLWANEVEGRHPSEYLESPEGMRLGGIDFAKPEDLEATVNAMFQTAGRRNHLVTTTTSVLIDGPPQVGNFVSTPHGMGEITDINNDTKMARVQMYEGAHVYQSVPLDQVRVSEFPWVGHPQIDDYVMTPNGPGIVLEVAEGPGPEFIPEYHVQGVEVIDGEFYPESYIDTYGPGDVQRINDLRDSGFVFHLNSQQALGQPKFPTKATSDQYLKALEKAQVKSEEFYWMGISRIPMLRDAVNQAKEDAVLLEKKLAKDPGHAAVYGEEERVRAAMEIDTAEAQLAEYLDDPDPSFILDANWGGSSFPVKALQDAVDSRSHFLDLNEQLYSSSAPSGNELDRWGPNRQNYGDGGEGEGLIIRDPHDDQPYHELVISLPQSDLFRGGHFPSNDNESPIVHIRFHEIVDEEGNRAILIDEMQSDWNNRGRSSGWRDILTPKDERVFKHLRDKERRLLEEKGKLYNELGGISDHDIGHWYDRQIRETGDKINKEIDARNAERGRLASEGRHDEIDQPHPEPKVFEYGRDREIVEKRLMEDHAGDEIFMQLIEVKKKFDRINARMRKYREAADAIEGGGGRGGSVSRGPLVMGDAAKYLAMKRMVRWAADHGQNRIIWTRGHEQGVRYSLYDDLPLDVERDTSHLDPSDYDMDFYYPHGNGDVRLGGHYHKSNVFPDQIAAMQQAPPVEIKWADVEDNAGDEFVLLPNQNPTDPSALSPDTAVMERWAKVVSETDDGVVAQPIDPLWDPAAFSFAFRGNTGGDSWGSWDVSIRNRVGDEIWNDSWDGSQNDKAAILFQIREKWERNLNNWSPNTAEADIPKMKQLISILEESETFDSEFSHVMDNMDYEFDEYSWQDFVSNYESENDGEGGSAYGDFNAIRDHEGYYERSARQKGMELSRLKEKQAEEKALGVASQDWEAQIATVESALAQARRNNPNKGHTEGYDRMLPQMATRMLKPYRNEADHAVVGIHDSIYKGRFSSENHQIISGTGKMHGWVMVLPEKMLKDAKTGTQSLFQKGNDIVKGASTWVGGPDGQRFIALTENADFSTLMHEFIGHATEEMSRRYPELWEAVELDMRKPLADWTVKEHEKFAKQVERYWMEGKAPSPELHTMMKMIREWMKAVYSSITQLGKPMPESTRVLLNRHLGQGITARPGARSYVPHVSQFDTLMDTAPGGTRLAAGGNMVGRPQVDKRNFGARRNRGILWQSGELALSARPIIDQYFRRTKFLETEAVRRELYEGGHPIPKNGRPPKNAWMIRDPDAGLDKLNARNKSRLTEDDFSRMIGEGDTPEEFVTKMEQIRKDHYAAPGEHPDWANDLENTRWVEGPKIEARIQNVFPSAPRGRTASTVGAANTLARMAGIYLRPLHYLVGNIPQNVMMVALTNPSALLNSAKYGAYSFLPRVIREMAVGPRDLFAHDRHLYNRIKTETGDIQAGAGLPDFYTVANNNFQRTERRLNKISQGTAEKLGEVADQPYRVSVWIAHAKKYGYNTPDEWRELLDSERGTPQARIRDEIAQRTREDMIDFNTISPSERQHISRFFYLWAFTRGFAKWPATFAREYPGRTGLALMAADPERTDDNGINIGALPASGILKSNQGPGKVRDLTFLDPTSGLRQQIETGISVAHGNFSGIGGMTTPPLETGLQAITGGPRAPKGGLGGLADQLARDTVPFYDIGRKVGAPGLGVSERVRRFLDADRFNVKGELGKGKNYEKKRGEDEQIEKILTDAQRLDVLDQVKHSQDAYWHHKYMEQQIRFGAQARRKGTKLTDQEKLVILYATAADYYPQMDLPPLSEALKADPALQEDYRTDLRDAMFGPRNEVLK